MNKTRMNIWGRDFELEVYYRTNAENIISEEQKDAYRTFTQPGVELESALTKLKEYIENNYPDRIQEEKISNIFRYIIPKIIFIPRQKEGKIVALLCDFAFDIEHGIALVFLDGAIKEIGSQDIIL